MDWLRRNPTAIPWTLLGVDIGLRIGARIYKTYIGYYQDETVDDLPIQSILPKLTQQEIGDLPYPPDAYPGARDVTSSYGSLRVYEWGPEDGRKVLLIHGITNPCVALGGVAQGLVDKGCRVILFGKKTLKLSIPILCPLYLRSIKYRKLTTARPPWARILLSSTADPAVNAFLHHLHPTCHNIVPYCLDWQQR